MPVSATRVDTGLHGVYSISSRWGFDFVSGYTVKAIPAGSNMSLEELRKGKYVLDEKQWLTVRIYMRANRRSKTQTSQTPANSISRVHRRCSWHGRGHPSPPEEPPFDGVCQMFFAVLTLKISHQRRDSGWIHTLLEEAENERMHLMFVG